MTAPGEGGGVPESVLRDAVRRAAAAGSVREVARQAGLASRTLDLFLADPRRRVHGRTLQRLRSWYVREVARRGSAVTAIDAAAALDILLDGLPPERRASVRADLIGILRTDRAGECWASAWLEGVEDEL